MIGQDVRACPRGTALLIGTRFNLVAVLSASASAAVVAVSAAFTGPDCPPRYAVEFACGITCATIWMSPQAINARGDIVGYAFGSCNLNDRAMVWYAGSPAVQALPTPSGTVWSRAYGISDAGHAVGEFSQGSGVRGFMVYNGVFYDMGTLPGGNKSVANAVNSSGLAVGFWGNVVTGPSPRSMHWTIGGGMQDLGKIFGEYRSELMAITEAGVSCGYIRIDATSLGQRAVVLGGMDLLTLPPSPGAWSSAAWGVNDLGQAAGFGFGPCLTPNGSGCITRYGFFWNGAEMVPLGFMPGCPWMNPNDINNAGQIVGNQNSQGGPAFCGAFLWERGNLHQLTDLTDLPPGYYIGEASAINNNGVIAASLGTPGAQGCFARLTPLPPVVADLDCDRAVGLSDLQVLLAAWGTENPSANIDNSGRVDAADLAAMLASWRR